MRLPADYIALAHQKALLLFTQDFLRGSLVQKDSLTEILSEDLPAHSARVPNSALLAYLKSLEEQIQGIEEKLHAFSLQEGPAEPPAEITKTPPSTPFSEETFT
jgi:hypothetical protein